MKITLVVLMFIFISIALRYSGSPENIEVAIISTGLAIICFFGVLNLNNVKDNNER